MAYSIGPNGNFIPDQKAPWYQNMWNSTMYAWAQNPTAPLQSIGDWWGAFNNYKMAKNNYNLTKDYFNFQRQLAQNNEDRIQQRFDWLKQARASSSL